MEHTPIAQLSPELPTVESKHFRARVTLIWPYSSSARQLALLLAEPDVRLRRKNGQVRARFSGASAKAIATTGVGIGDEVVLSLRGAQFVTEGAVSTPGKSIDWELVYAQTAVIRVFRNGQETANVEVIDAAPTPAPQSPARRESGFVPSPASQYSSPAFLKRVRLSDGPFFQAPYDPLTDESEEGHDRKRRRKSYRDWKTWTYSARTPSPEKEDTTVENELEWLEASPSRAAQLPQTPTSPSKPDMPSTSVDSQHDRSIERTEPEAPSDNAAPSLSEHDTGKNSVGDAGYDELYAGPDEYLQSDALYAFGGDTEVDTEVNTEEEYPAQGETEGVSTTTTEAGTDDVQHMDREAMDVDVAIAPDVRTENEKDTDRIQTVEVQQVAESMPTTGAGDQVAAASLTLQLDAPKPAMPPPTLSISPNNPLNLASGGLLTPIGREPASPTLQPLDSANLPFPSPFPGERENNATSYFDHLVTSGQSAEVEEQDDEEEKPPSEASYIGETSFFSSIGSSKASTLHPNHESVFTPVRFTFGIDGAGFSRPMELSSPPPEAQPDREIDTAPEMSASTTIDESSFNIQDAGVSPMPQHTVDIESPNEEVRETATDDTLVTVEDVQGQDVSMLSSDSEDEGEEEVASSTEDQDQMATGHILPSSTDNPSEDDADDDSALHHEDSKTADESKDHQQDSLSERNSPIEDNRPRSPQDQVRDRNQSPSMDLDSHSEFVNLDSATGTSHTAEAPDERIEAHTQSQEPELSADETQIEHSFSVDHSYESMIEATDEYLQDAFPMGHASHEFEVEQYSESEQDSAIKEEPTEDGLESQLDQSHALTSEVSNISTRELSMTVSEQDHATTEMQTVDISATVSPRNTRSRAKAQTPSINDEVPLSNRATRSTRSRGSVSSIARSVISPPRTRTRSARSPSQDTIQNSPSSVRSYSSLLSPRKTMAVAVAAARKSPQKSLRRSLNHEFASNSTKAKGSGPSSTKSQSQEPGASQDNYPDEVFVKKWEEDVSTGYSVSPAPTLEEAAGKRTADFSSPVKGGTPRKEEEMDTEPPSGTDTEPKTKSRTRAGRKKPAPKALEPKSSQFAASEIGSPSRRLRSAGPIEPAAQSPGNVRRTRRNVYTLSEPQDSEVTVETSSRLDKKPEENSPHSEGQDRQDDPQQTAAIGANETHSHVALNPQAVVQKHKPMTPEPTQQANMDSQPGLVAATAEHKSLLTPQQTQKTSADLRSSQTNANMDAAVLSPPTKKSALTKTTPRSNRKATDIASASASPALKEEHPSQTESTPEQPSIGLSTPLAYYTPLKDLLYFLNRSSQFHSAANPDILALVTAPTTPAEKAKKGPKHWNTTLHVTDASSWPATTTVQCFRAYQDALPEAAVGDVILLRAFAVKSLNRHPTLVSADESAWCVWRWGKPVWGAKRGVFGELKAREEVKGPEVERGEGEWREVERLRKWFLGKVEQELQEKEESQVKTRSKDKAKGAATGGD